MNSHQLSIEERDFSFLCCPESKSAFSALWAHLTRRPAGPQLLPSSSEIILLLLLTSLRFLLVWSWSFSRSPRANFCCLLCVFNRSAERVSCHITHAAASALGWLWPQHQPLGSPAAQQTQKYRSLPLEAAAPACFLMCRLFPPARTLSAPTANAGRECQNPAEVTMCYNHCSALLCRAISSA